MPKTFPLSKSIKVHQEKVGAVDVKEIIFRDPVADDFFDLEAPSEQVYSTDGKQITVKVKGAAVKQWLTRLSDLDGGVIGQIPVGDLNPMVQWLLGEINAAKN